MQDFVKYHDAKRSFETRYIMEALQACNGRVNLTSRVTGLNKVTLTEKMRRYGIERKVFFAITSADAMEVSPCVEQ